MVVTKVNQRRHALPKNDKILSSSGSLLMRIWYMSMEPYFSNFKGKAKIWKQIFLKG